MGQEEHNKICLKKKKESNTRAEVRSDAVEKSLNGLFVVKDPQKGIRGTGNCRFSDFFFFSSSL